MDDFQFQTLQKGIDGINARLDRQNGRLGEAEQSIAVLQDRSAREGWLGGISGGTVAGALIAIKEWLSR